MIEKLFLNNFDRFMNSYQTDKKTEIKIDKAIKELIIFLEQNNYHGWEPYDVPQPKLLSINKSKFAKVAVTQFFRLSPICFHKIFNEKKIYTKAFALFALSFLNLFEISGKETDKKKALFFLEWLKLHKSSQSLNFSLGTRYKLNMKSYDAAGDTPSPIITALAIEAFLTAYKLFGDDCWLEAANSGIKFFMEELPQVDVSPDLGYFVYHPNNKNFIPNLPAVLSGTLAHYYSFDPDPEILDIINKNLNYVSSWQRKDGSWLYHPNTNYIDSFHTGFILEGYAKYKYYIGSNKYSNIFDNGMNFYLDNFFSKTGQPYHMKLVGVPTNADSLLTRLDLRDCSQALVLFSLLMKKKDYSDNLPFELANWSIDFFRDIEGYFYYQNIPFYTIKGPFISMQAWILFALTCFFKVNYNKGSKVEKYEEAVY